MSPRAPAEEKMKWSATLVVVAAAGLEVAVGGEPWVVGSLVFSVLLALTDMIGGC